MAITLHLYISKENALLQGSARSGEVDLPVTEEVAQAISLCPQACVWLAAQDGYVIRRLTVDKIPEAVPEIVACIIDAAAREAREAQQRADNDTAVLRAVSNEIALCDIDEMVSQYDPQANEFVDRARQRLGIRDNHWLADRVEALPEWQGMMEALRVTRCNRYDEAMRAFLSAPVSEGHPEDIHEWCKRIRLLEEHYRVPSIRWVGEWRNAIEQQVQDHYAALQRAHNRLVVMDKERRAAAIIAALGLDEIESAWVREGLAPSSEIERRLIDAYLCEPLKQFEPNSTACTARACACDYPPCDHGFRDYDDKVRLSSAQYRTLHDLRKALPDGATLRLIRRSHTCARSDETKHTKIAEVSLEFEGYTLRVEIAL